MGQHSEAELNTKFVETAKLMNIYLNHFPKFEKYALAQQIRQCMYEVYALIVEGQKRYHKKTTLSSLDIRHEQLRMFVRVAFELGYFGFKNQGISDNNPDELAERRFHTLGVMIDEIGRMLNGWIKAETAKQGKAE